MINYQLGLRFSKKAFIPSVPSFPKSDEKALSSISQPSAKLV